MHFDMHLQIVGQSNKVDYKYTKAINIILFIYLLYFNIG